MDGDREGVGEGEAEGHFDEECVPDSVEEVVWHAEVVRVGVEQAEWEGVREGVGEGVPLNVLLPHWDVVTVVVGLGETLGVPEAHTERVPVGDRVGEREEEREAEEQMVEEGEVLGVGVWVPCETPPPLALPVRDPLTLTLRVPLLHTDTLGLVEALVVAVRERVAVVERLALGVPDPPLGEAVPPPKLLLLPALVAVPPPPPTPLPLEADGEEHGEGVVEDESVVDAHKVGVRVEDKDAVRVAEVESVGWEGVGERVLPPPLPPTPPPEVKLSESVGEVVGVKLWVEVPQEVAPLVEEGEGVDEPIPRAGEPVAAAGGGEGDTLVVVEGEGLREAVNEVLPVMPLVVEPERDPAAAVAEVDNDPAPPLGPLLGDTERERVGELVGEFVREGEGVGVEEGHRLPLSVALPLEDTLGLPVEDAVLHPVLEGEAEGVVEMEGEPVGGTRLALPPPRDPDKVLVTDLVRVTEGVRLPLMQVLPLRLRVGLRLRVAQVVGVTEPLREGEALGLPLPLLDPRGEEERLMEGLWVRLKEGV